MIKQYIENEHHDQKVTDVIDKRIQKQAENMALFFWGAIALSVVAALVTIATWWNHYGSAY